MHVILCNQGFTHVISVVGNDLLRLQPAMIEAAIETGVKHFYPSEWNSDISQKEIYSMRYFRDKQVTRSHLAAKAKEHKDFHYTLFITGIFTEWSILEFYGFDDEKLHVTTYGKPEARVGVTSIPEFVSSFTSVLRSTNFDSIARYTVSSLLLPFTPTGVSGSERTIRVTGTSTTFQGLVDSLGEAKNTTYEVDYLPVEEASRMEEQARLDGNDLSEMMWSIKPLVASGFGVADGNGSRLDNDLFDFTPETITETFSRMFKQKTKLS